MSVPAALALASASSPAQAAARRARVGLDAARAGDLSKAAATFEEARVLFERAESRLSGPLPSLGIAVPGLSSNLRAARTLTRVGAELSVTGVRLATDVSPDSLRVSRGGVPLDEVERIRPILAESAEQLTDAYADLRESRRVWLAGRLRQAVDDVYERVGNAAASTRRGAEAARLASQILGADGERRYFLAIQNPAESRASGGFLGNFGEIVARDGRLRLERFGSLDDVRYGGTPYQERSLDAPKDFLDRYKERLVDAKSWTHVNITPDFPTVARMIRSLYPQSGGREVHGVIGVDPQGLAALLQLTGAVPIDNWPEPLTARNVVSVTTRDQYIRLAGRPFAERRAFLADVAQAVWGQAVTSDLGSITGVVDTLGKATDARHLSVYLFEPEEASLVRSLGIAGDLGPLSHDSLMLVDHNGSGNKIGGYLERTITYLVALDPRRGAADVRARIDVRLENTAPGSGLPLEVIGESGGPLPPGTNFSRISLFTPLGVGRREGRLADATSGPELGRLSHSGYVLLPPETAGDYRFFLGGEVPLTDDGWYLLDVLQQPRLVPDEVNVIVTVPDGWRIVGVRGGLQRLAPGRAQARLELAGDRTLGVRLERTGTSRVWGELLE
jgi:hypothetical protein